ncbi:unnamed protein product, partial [Choristocarpus tenellus]
MGHIKVSEQGRDERRFVLGLNEDILAEVKEWSYAIQHKHRSLLRPYWGQRASPYHGHG